MKRPLSQDFWRPQAGENPFSNLVAVDFSDEPAVKKSYPPYEPEFIQDHPLNAAEEMHEYSPRTESHYGFNQDRPHKAPFSRLFSAIKSIAGAIPSPSKNLFGSLKFGVKEVALFVLGTTIIAGITTQFTFSSQEKAAANLPTNYTASPSTQSTTSLSQIWAKFASIFSKDAGTSELFYLEIKAMTTQGHPVAGAQLVLGGTALGVTDAFGEWRRYLKLRRNEGVKVVLTKKTSQGEIIGNEIIHVPSKESTEAAEDMNRRTPELRLRIRMQSAQVQAKVNKIMALKKDELSAVQTSSTPPTKYHHLDLTIQSNLNLSNDLSAERFSTQIVPQLRQKLTDLGITLGASSDFKMTLSQIAQAGAGGLIRVDVSYLQDHASTEGNVGKKWRQISFLHNYKANAAQTVESLLSVVRQALPQTFTVHRDGAQWYVGAPRASFWQPVAADFLTNSIQKFPLGFNSRLARFEVIAGNENPCLSHPNFCTLEKVSQGSQLFSDGKRARMGVQFISSLPQDSEIYIGGFKPQEFHEGVFYYHSSTGAETYLTIVRDNQILYRQRLKGDPQHIELVSLPKSDRLALAEVKKF